MDPERVTGNAQSGAIVAASFFGMLVGIAKWVAIVFVAREVAEVLRLFAAAR